MADLTTGKRKVSRIGNADLNLKYKLDSLPVGTYYWSVQAVNNAYKGSSWADEQTFTISVVNAGFAADTVCTGDSTHFTDLTLTSGEDIISWYWDFGDGESDIVQNPVHLYSSAGNYQVKLVVNTTSYADSITKTVVVKAVPLTDFTVDLVCQGTPTSVTNTTDNNGLTINAWLWNYGDGGTSTLEDPGSHGYLNPGDYNITLWAFADNGCSASVQKTATVASYPSAGITADGPLVFCKGDSVTLSVPEDNNYTYNWLMNGTGLTGTDSSNYVAKVTGNYSVEVVNNTGSCKTTSSQVAVTAQDAPAAPAISAGGVLEFCQGDSVILSVTNTAGYIYQWKLNGGAVGIDSSRYNAKSSGTYSLTVSNSTGCSVNSTNSIDVIVNPKPTVPTVNISGPTTFCQGSSVELSVTDNPAYTYQWENNSAAITGAVTNSYTAQNSGVYALKITNSSGCFIKTENVTVTVLTAPSAPLISADSDLEFCQGDSVILSVTHNAGYSYEWRLNGGTVGIDSSRHAAKNSGSFNLVVSNTNGCSVSSSNSIDIVVNPVPSAGAVNLSGPATFCGGDSVILSTPSVTGNSYNWRNEYGLIPGATSDSYTAKSSSIYQLDISNTHGCSVTTSAVTVTVKVPPTVPVIESANYTEGVCPGEDQIKLSATQTVSGYHYLWYKDGLPRANDTLSYLYLSEQGNYILEAELNGCIKESEVFNINLPEAPEKPMLHAQGPTVWYITCSNKNADSYKWYCNGNLIEGADDYYYVAVRKMGDYQVSIGTIQGCFTRSDIVTIPTGDTGLDDVDPFKGLKLYPNPSTGLFTIEIDNNIFGEMLIRIITESGKEIVSLKLDKTTEHFLYEVDLSRQPQGLYIINLLIDRYIAMRKIIVE